ncbi:hypothetical protein CR513_52291, partial [Mucuna pruriens]
MKFQSSKKAKRQRLLPLHQEFELLLTRTMTIFNKKRVHGKKMQNVIVVDKILRLMTPKFQLVSKNVDLLSTRLFIEKMKHHKHYKHNLIVIILPQKGEVVAKVEVIMEEDTHKINMLKMIKQPYSKEKEEEEIVAGEEDMEATNQQLNYQN